MSRIVSLMAENVKRLEAVHIEPDGSTVVIGGRNGQGKSSVLDSIQYALGDKGQQCKEPVRRGTDKARVIIQTDDGLTVTRTMTKGGGGTLKVTAKDGASYPSPQAMLDKLVGKLSFDPLAFLRLKPKEQVDAVKTLVGVDLTELDVLRANKFAERTELSRALRSQSACEDAVHYEDVPNEEVSISQLIDQLHDLEAANSAHDPAEQEVQNCENRVSRAYSECVILEQKMIAAKRAHDKAKQDRDAARTAASMKPAVDTTELRESIKAADGINVKVRANRERARAIQALEKLREQVSTLTGEIIDIDGKKAEAIAQARFPVEGLGFGDDGLTLKGLPLDQASSAEQLRVSVAMGFSLNPKLKVLLIRDGSLLDHDSLKDISDMAQEADAQIWIERVGDGSECSVIIEDGNVLEDDDDGK